MSSILFVKLFNVRYIVKLYNVRYIVCKIIKCQVHCLTGFLPTFSCGILFIAFYIFLIFLYVCNQCLYPVGIGTRISCMQHPCSNHYANVTSLPPTSIGKVPFCVHRHGLISFFLAFKLVLFEGKKC